MIALVLLAQLAATPTPAPVVKAESGQTRTLADVARERKLGIKGVKGGTISVAGAPVADVPLRGGTPPNVSGQVGAHEAEWTQRNAAARRELADARAALTSADSNLPKWSVSGRGSAYTAAMLDQMREDALLPYRARVSAAQARVDALPEEARKAGAQPGWVR